MGNQNSESSHRILKVKPNSPAVGLPIEPMLDFLIYTPPEANTNMNIDKFVANNENKEIELTFFNIASQTVWKGKITPKKWEGEGLLGFTLHQEDYQTAHNRVIHILEFMVNSPLHKAGFNPNVDYILGTPERSFETTEEFLEYINIHNKKPLNLYVYNSDEEKTRELTLIPDSGWGGKGQLGGEIGFGHVHSLPIRKKIASKNAKIKEHATRPGVILKENVEIVKKEEEKATDPQSKDEVQEPAIEKAKEVTEPKIEVNKTEEIKQEKAVEIIVPKAVPKQVIEKIEKAKEIKKENNASPEPISKIEEDVKIEKAMEIIHNDPIKEVVETKKVIEKAVELDSKKDTSTKKEIKSSEVSIDTFDDDIMI